MKGATRRERSRKHLLAVSIHAPREGRDVGLVGGAGCPNGFQSTRPVKGATVGEPAPPAEQRVSIHAPREGRDPRLGLAHPPRRSFNPRAP